MKKHALRMCYKCIMSNNETVKEHYVPKFLLKNFTDSGRLYCYRKDESKIYSASVDNVFVINDLYEEKLVNMMKQWDDYILRNKLEEEFASLEGLSATVVRSIIAKCDANISNNNSLICTKKEKEILKKLIVNIWLRNPKTMAAMLSGTFDDIEELKQFRDMFKNDDVRNAFKLEEQDIDRIIEFSERLAVLSPNFDGGIFEKIIKKTLNYSVAILAAPKEEEFLISDNPVIVVDEKIKDWYEIVIMPISKKYAIALNAKEITTAYKNRIFHLTSEDMNTFNKTLFDNNEYTSVIACESKEYIQKYLRRCC